MISTARVLLLCSVACAGCQTAGKVAVTGFHVIDAPAKFIRDRVDNSSGTNTANAQPGPSDVSNPGEPVSASTPTPPPHHVAAKPTPRPHTAATSPHKTSPAATPRPQSTQTVQFPTAKPVAGKPGYVYSIDPKGGIVDVTGYKSGDKAKDPYTQQIFIVP